MDEDPIMQELRDVRRQLLKEAGGDIGELLKRADREAPRIMAEFRKSGGKTKGRPKPPAFRGATGKASRHRGNGHPN